MAWREDATITKLRTGDPALVNNIHCEILTAARTITAADNGTTFILAAAAGVAVTLPAPQLSLRYKFIVGLAFATSNWVVGTASAAAIIEGLLTVNGALVAAANEKQINFVNSAELLGDWAEVVSDGTSWFLSGQGSGAGSITVTAP